ncbi:MAG TPA: hypothetical protein VKW76_09730 [Candidatus Binatia bacterium]|nr:hypothetical protein [Candidatus Binatia bacterium]
MTNARIVVSVVAFLAVGTIGCRERPCPKPPQTPTAGRVSAGDRVAAMLSVHAYAYHGTGVLPRGVTIASLNVMRLARAVEILQTDSTAVAPARRRRAIAKLIAYGEHAADRADQEQLIDAAKILLEGRQSIGDLLGRTDPRSIEVHALEKVLFERLTALAIPGCGPDQFDPANIDWTFNAVVHVTAKVTVALDPGEVARRIDPQNWDACSPFFSPPENTYIASCDGVASQACPPPTGNDPCLAPRSPSGSTYHADRFFEHYHSSTGIDADFKDMLDVTTTQYKFCSTDPDAPCAAPDYQVCYALPLDDPSKPSRRLAGCVGGVPATLALDEGFLTACKDTKPGHTVVTVSKKLSFTDPLNTLGADAAYRIMAAETTESVAELACCPSCRIEVYP